MQTLIVYDSRYGNTEQIAHAIAAGAGGVGTATVAHVDGARAALAARPDLLLVGGPTQRRGASPALRAFLSGLAAPDVSGVAVATFDTRYKGLALVMGSAAAEAAKRLGEVGARPAVAPEGFFVSRGGDPGAQSLLPGEVDRAVAWGRKVASGVAAGG